MKVKELAKCYILRGIDRWFDDYINLEARHLL